MQAYVSFQPSSTIYRIEAYGKLSNLGIVHAHDLRSLASTELQAGDEIDEEEDNAGHDEGVGHAGNGVSKLIAELDPVLVEPTTGNDGATV